MPEQGTLFHIDEDLDVNVRVDLAMMTMQASQCPVLVRRDPVGTWWVIAQGPPQVLHAHQIDPVAAALDGFPTPWDAAMDVAREHTLPWRVQQHSDPAELIKLGLSLLDLIEKHKEGDPE